MSRPMVRHRSSKTVTRDPAGSFTQPGVGEHARHPGRGRHARVDLDRVGRAVRREDDLAAGHEGRGEGRRERACEQAVAGVVLLRPRVGEVDVVGRDLRRRQERLDEVGRRAPDEAAVVVAHARGREAAGIACDALAAVLDAEPVALGVGARLLEQEVVLAGPDLDDERPRRVREGGRGAAAEDPVFPGRLVGALDVHAPVLPPTRADESRYRSGRVRGPLNGSPRGRRGRAATARRDCGRRTSRRPRRGRSSRSSR